MITLKNAMSISAILIMALCVSVCFGAGKTSNPLVVIETSKGNITLELYKDKAPKTVENFLEYMNAGYYNGTIFHRVIKGFMIQGGGFTEDMVEKSGLRDPIENEATNGLKNNIGTIAMARLPSGLDTATSQFFINTRNNGGADEGFTYAVFGKVKKGMNVVYKIENVETGSKGIHNDVPIKPVIIKSVHLKDE